jgi:hypothetical protein
VRAGGVSPALSDALVYQQRGFPTLLDFAALQDLGFGLRPVDRELAIEVASSGVELRWRAVPGEKFTVEGSADGRNWEPVGEVTAATPQAAFSSPAGATPRKAGFFRLQPAE